MPWTSTVEAMQSGAVYGYRGLVKEILARLEEELGTRRPWWLRAGTPR